MATKSRKRNPAKCHVVATKIRDAGGKHPKALYLVGVGVTKRDGRSFYKDAYYVNGDAKEAALVGERVAKQDQRCRKDAVTINLGSPLDLDLRSKKYWTGVLVGGVSVLVLRGLLKA